MHSNRRKLAVAGSIFLLSVGSSISYAADDLIAGSDLDKIAEIAKGYGSVKGPETSDTGQASLEMRTDGNKYFLTVLAVKHKNVSVIVQLYSMCVLQKTKSRHTNN